MAKDVIKKNFQRFHMILNNLYYALMIPSALAGGGGKWERNYCISD